MNKPLGSAEATSHREIELAQMYPIISEVLASGGTFTLTITGTSMYPTLLGKRDRVTLSAAPARLKKLDLPLYRRKDGSFVLHRIIGISKDDSYICCGDHQTLREPGIRQEQIVGLVTAIERKGKQFPATKRKYRIWVRVWYWLLPMRGLIFRAARRLGRKNKQTKDSR